MTKGGRESSQAVQPVAYDAEGQPLYAAPVDQAEKPSAEQPEENAKSDAEVAKKHQESKELYPDINLSEGEYVIAVVERHPIGVIIPMSVTIGLILLILGGLYAYPYLLEQTTTVNLPGVVPVTVMSLLLIILIGLVGYAAVWIYLKNTLYLTNESLIQVIRLGLFSKHEHTVELGRIEDTSFRQVGVLQVALDYGSIRLSTVGDESTYRLNFVASPKQQIATVNNTIEEYKNSRGSKSRD